MRLIHVLVPRESAPRVLAVADEHHALGPIQLRADRQDGREWAAVLLGLANDQVGPFIDQAEREVEEVEFFFLPTGALFIQPPLEQVHERVRNVSHLSTLEMVLSSVQSLGSWYGMLLYALFSGIVGAYAVIFSSGYLLVAAMLIAPMGAPALVSAVGAAVGDWRMTGRGAIRFFAAIATLVVSAAALGLAFGLQYSTTAMEEITSLSIFGTLLALVAGAAGAQSQVESDRGSLVTGTATGFLVAAALSPTSAVLGLSLVLKRWDYTALMSFQVILQYSTIVLGGWATLALYGLHPERPSLGHGGYLWRWLTVATLAVAATGLTLWQTALSPTFRKADLSMKAVELTRGAVRPLEEARLISADARFTRSDLTPGSAETLLVQVVAEQRPSPPSRQELEARLRDAIRHRIVSELPNVFPLVVVTVIPGGSGPLAP